MGEWLQSVGLLNASGSVNPAAIVIAVLTVLLVAGLVRSALGQSGQGAENRQLADKRIRDATYRNAEDNIRKKILPALRKHGAIVIEIIHDTDWDEYFREEAPRNISFDEVFQAIRRINAAPKADIILILHTLGGYSLPSIMLADAIRKHRARGGSVMAFVPYVAMSGGTILALASQHVWMGDIARLGPIDTQFGEFSGDALRKLPEYKPADKQGDGVLLFRIEAQKYETYYENELKRLIDKDEIDSCVYDGSLSHSYAFNRDDALRYGIRALPDAKGRASKRARAIGALATKLVDERLSMIKNHWQKNEKAEPAPVADEMSEGTA